VFAAVVFHSHSGSQHVMLLDCDSFPLKDPAPLFQSMEYLTHGSLFWPDFWHDDKGAA
jgi:alpha 1,2-mannosyltransferase